MSELAQIVRVELTTAVAVTGVPKAIAVGLSVKELTLTGFRLCVAQAEAPATA